MPRRLLQTPLLKPKNLLLNKPARFAIPRGLFFLFFCSMFFCAFVYCADEPVSGDTFVTASLAEPSNLIPFFASDSASASVSGLIFNGLIKYDKDLKLVGDLAQSWDIQDEGLKIIFHLKKNVLWQDGSPFTAADVEFT